jgi:molecular chaperone DnaK (HSP70)
MFGFFRRKKKAEAAVTATPTTEEACSNVVRFVAPNGAPVELGLDAEIKDALEAIEQTTNARIESFNSRMSDVNREIQEYRLVASKSRRK